MSRLFRHWSNPGVIGYAVVFRLLANIGLTALVVDATGRGALVLVAIAVTLLSSALMVLVLERSIPDYSLFEVVLQLGFLVLTAVVVAQHPSLVRVAGGLFVGVGVVVGLLFAMLTYAELDAP